MNPSTWLSFFQLPSWWLHVLHSVMNGSWWPYSSVSTAPSMMSLRRHIDSQLATGSPRLVESCLLAEQQGEGTLHTPRSRAAFRPTRSQSFGHLDCLPLPPLSSAVSHPSIICSSNPNPPPVSLLSYSSSCLPSSVGGAPGPHSSHMHHLSFQPMDPIPDFSLSDVSHLSHSDSLGYPFSFQLLTHHVWTVLAPISHHSFVFFKVTIHPFFLPFYLDIIIPQLITAPVQKYRYLVKKNALD